MPGGVRSTGRDGPTPETPVSAECQRIRSSPGLVGISISWSMKSSRFPTKKALGAGLGTFGPAPKTISSSLQLLGLGEEPVQLVIAFNPKREITVIQGEHG